MTPKLEQFAAEIADQVAERVTAELEQRLDEMLEQRTAAPELVDAAELARRFGVSRDYCYEHAAELGAIRLGAGSRARLRFDPERAAAAFAGEPDKQPRRSSPRHRPGSSAVELLDYEGDGRV